VAEYGLLQHNRILAVVLGASEWPHCLDFAPSTSFRRSANDMAKYLCDAAGLGLASDNVLTAIDLPDPAADILHQVRLFIRGRRSALKARGTPASDLLFYYVGHGGFGDGARFYLSVRSTYADDPLHSSIAAESLGNLIRTEAGGLRTYLLLDCCFSASATAAFMAEGPLGAAGVKLADALPPQGDPAGDRGELPEFGVALLCASGPRDIARAPKNQSHTMFTGALLDVLRRGDPTAPSWLTLDDLRRLIGSQLRERFKNEAVLPQVHAPQQRKGRLDLVPLFQNPARQFGEAALLASQTTPDRSVPGRRAWLRRVAVGVVIILMALLAVQGAIPLWQDIALRIHRHILEAQLAGYGFNDPFTNVDDIKGIETIHPNPAECNGIVIAKPPPPRPPVKPMSKEGREMDEPSSFEDYLQPKEIRILNNTKQDVGFAAPIDGVFYSQQRIKSGQWIRTGGFGFVITDENDHCRNVVRARNNFVIVDN